MGITGRRVSFAGYECVAAEERYAASVGGRVRIQLYDRYDGGPVATATVNIPEVDLAEDEVLIKDWSENVGMMDALRSAGIAHDTGRRDDAGHVPANVPRLAHDDRDALGADLPA